MSISTEAFRGNIIRPEQLPKDQLGELQARLMEPFFVPQSTSFSPDFSGLSTQQLRIVEITPFSPLKEEATAVINYGYNSRYQGEDGIESDVTDLTGEVFTGTRQSHLLAAVETIGNKDVVLATLGGTSGYGLEVFDFFQMPEGKKWPHEEENGYPGEIGKYSMHPILDFLHEEFPSIRKDINNYKVGMLRKLYPDVMDTLVHDGVTHAMFILGLQVKRFIRAAGIIPVYEIGAEENDSAVARYLRDKFPVYWSNHPRLCPRLYLAPKELLPVQIDD